MQVILRFYPLLRQLRGSHKMGLYGSINIRLYENIYIKLYENIYIRLYENIYIRLYESIYINFIYTCITLKLICKKALPSLFYMYFTAYKITKQVDNEILYPKIPAYLPIKCFSGGASAPPEIGKHIKHRHLKVSLFQKPNRH